MMHHLESQMEAREERMASKLAEREEKMNQREERMNNKLVSMVEKSIKATNATISVNSEPPNQSYTEEDVDQEDADHVSEKETEPAPKRTKPNDSSDEDSDEEDSPEVRQRKRERNEYKRSLATIFQQYPEAQGSTVAPLAVYAASKAMQFEESVERKVTSKLKPAKCLVSQFDKHFKRLFDTCEPIVDPMKHIPGKNAYTQAKKFLLPPSRTRKTDKFEMADKPLELRVDPIPVPPIAKPGRSFTLFNDKIQTAQAGWTDKLCTELNHCEWAQLTTVQLLRKMKTKYAEFSDVVAAIDEIGTVVNLCGNNISRAEETAAALKTNVVLQQRDAFLDNTFKAIPASLTDRARVQPIFDHPHLIGKPIEAMASALTVSQTSLAVTALASRAHTYSRPTPRGGSRGPPRGDNFRQRNFPSQRGQGHTPSPLSNLGRDNTPSPATSRGGYPTGNRGRGRGRGFDRGRGHKSTYQSGQRR